MTTPTEKPPLFNVHNLLVLLGIVITIVGVVYFTAEFIQRLSDWGKLAILILLTGGFIALGHYFEQTSEEGGALFTGAGLRWIRVPTALYLLGVVGGVTSVVFFVGMDDVDTRVKVVVTVGVGLGLIFLAARLQKRKGGQASE